MDLAKLVAEQSMPRYIHKYNEPPPYHWDNHTDPAHGSFGLIRKATSEITGEVVAIKIISRCFSDKDRLSIAREIGALEVCHHPNLIQLIDAYETTDDVRLVLTPWAPFTLFMFLSKNEKALSASCPWFVPGQQSSMDIVLGMHQGLADGLHYLHLKSIKHKDIKPENILLHREASKDIRPIIADFGTSRVYKTGGRTRFTDSTYMYLAPEQVNHTGSSLKSDVWQLGCCFAQILTRACGGYTASLVLGDSYQNTDEMRTCTIAKELVHFLSALRRLCEAMPDVLELTCGMLKEDPATRWTIAQVRAELVRVIQERQ
jgi:serine/threonine protein kinase